MAEPVDLAQRIVAQASAGEQVEACAGRSLSTTVRVHGGRVESLTTAESLGVGVRVVSDGREGVAHAGSFDLDLIDGLLAEARDNAGFAEPDPRVGLAAPDGVAFTPIDPWSDEVAAMPTDDKIRMALEAEELCRSADPRVRGVRTSIYGDSRFERALVNTEGIHSVRRGTSASLSTHVIIDDADGATRTGAAVEAARTPLGLDPESVAAKAVNRGLALIGAVRARTARPLVVFEPRFAATILGLVAGMLSGELVVKKRTPFAGRVGDEIAAPALTMLDDPTDRESLAAASADGEGLACRSVPLITDGRLAGYLNDCRSGRGLGTPSSGSALRSVRGGPSPGCRSLHVKRGSGDLASFIAGIDDGLLVCSLQGLHSGINPVSGDLSVGVEGIWIRDGQLAEPIREATLAGAIPRILLDLAAVGEDAEYQPGGQLVPSLVVAGLTVGGD